MVHPFLGSVASRPCSTRFAWCIDRFDRAIFIPLEYPRSDLINIYHYFIADEETEISTNERSRNTLHSILNKVQEKLPPKITSDGLESRPESAKSQYKRKTQAQQKEEYLLKKGKGGSDMKMNKY